jgi:sugar phosphate isomerase/epimerase
VTPQPLGDRRPAPDEGWLLGLAATAPRSASFDERLAAAASVGLDHLGVRLSAVAAAGEEAAVASRLRRAADEAGVRLDGVEMLYRAADPDAVEATLPFLERLLTLAGGIGAHRILANTGLPDDEARAARTFRGVCDRAAEVGLVVLLEFVPWTTLPDLVTAARVVERSGAANGGVVLDCWHFFRGSGDIGTIAQVPVGTIREIQLCDGALLPDPDVSDPLEETLHRRRLPGDGEFPLAALLEAVAEHHGRVPLTLEVLSDELDQRPVDAAVASMAVAARALLAERGASEGSAR